MVVQPLEVVEATGPSEAEKGVVGTKWLKPETGMRVRLTDKVPHTSAVSLSLSLSHTHTHTHAHTHTHTHTLTLSTLPPFSRSHSSTVSLPCSRYNPTGPSKEEKGGVGTKWLKPETGMRVRHAHKVPLVRLSHTVY